MNEIDLSNQELMDFITKKVMDLPQVACPVAHYFAPGLYIREVVFPAGIFAIGHKQRFEQFNIFLRGKIAMVGKNGQIKELSAPMVFVAPPGQKMGYVMDTVVWLNVFANPDNETDIDILEDRYLDKSGPWTDQEEEEKLKRWNDHQTDRDDFESLHLDFDPVEVQAPLPTGLETALSVRNSDIHGKGIFTSWPFIQGEPIGPITINGKSTILAKYVNHAKKPNATIKVINDSNMILVAIKDINGCKGGDQGEEITIDYNNRGNISCPQQ